LNSPPNSDAVFVTAFKVVKMVLHGLAGLAVTRSNQGFIQHLGLHFEIAPQSGIAQPTGITRCIALGHCLRGWQMKCHATNEGSPFASNFSRFEGLLPNAATAHHW
jgi:hypothetical protein